MILGNTGTSIRINDHLKIYPNDITGETVVVDVLPVHTDSSRADFVDTDKLDLDVLKVLHRYRVSMRKSVASLRTDRDDIPEDSEKVTLMVSGHDIPITSDELYELSRVLGDVRETRDNIRDTIGEISMKTLRKKFNDHTPIRFHSSTHEDTTHSGIPVACDGVFLTVSLRTDEQMSYRLSTITTLSV